MEERERCYSFILSRTPHGTKESCAIKIYIKQGLPTFRYSNGQVLLPVGLFTLSLNLGLYKVKAYEALFIVTS
jgi:hypothetical protein